MAAAAITITFAQIYLPTEVLLQGEYNQAYLRGKNVYRGSCNRLSLPNCKPHMFVPAALLTFPSHFYSVLCSKLQVQIYALLRANNLDPHNCN